MRRSRSRGRHHVSGGRARRRLRRREVSPLLRSASPSFGRRRTRLRRRRTAAPAPSNSREFSPEYCPGPSGRAWSPYPGRGCPPGGSGVNAIPLGRRRECSDEEQPEEETKVRVWVAHTDCAKIIGRGGRTMRDIEYRSRTKLKVQREDEMDVETKERYVDIVGTRAEQRAALEQLLSLTSFCREDEGEVLKDHRVADDGEGRNEAPRVIEILPEEVGRVLGRKGETVKVLERDSGTKIEVDKTTGRLEIFGTAAQQERGLELVLAEVSFAKETNGTVLKEQAPRPAAEDTELALPPAKLWVRDREAGRVIGRGGETVREIMEKTGADIKVQKAEDMKAGETDREIRIFGQQEQQQEALRLVLAEVSWARGPEAMLKEPQVEEPPRKPSPPPRRPRREEPPPPKERKEPRAEDDERVGRGSKNKSENGSGAWVCGTCGGDHRTKECPHATGLLGMGMAMGMQMGMQAMGMGGLGMMGPPMMPPMMPGMPMLPGVLPPGALPPPGASDSSGSDDGSSAGSSSPSDPAGPAGDGAAEDAAPIDGSRAPGAPHRRKRRRREVDGARGYRGARSPRRRARRRTRGGDEELGVGGLLPGDGGGRRRAGGRGGRRRRRMSAVSVSASRSNDDPGRRAAALAAERAGELPTPPMEAKKKKIFMSDL